MLLQHLALSMNSVLHSNPIKKQKLPVQSMEQIFPSSFDTDRLVCIQMK